MCVCVSHHNSLLIDVISLRWGLTNAHTRSPRREIAMLLRLFYNLHQRVQIVRRAILSSGVASDLDAPAPETWYIAALTETNHI